jgi:RNA polymerase sigma factor (sigma-70 family)
VTTRRSSRRIRAAQLMIGFRAGLRLPSARGTDSCGSSPGEGSRGPQRPLAIMQPELDTQFAYSDATPIETLVGAVIAGQQAAFYQLYQRTARCVFEAAATLLCSEDAREVVDDVYLHVWAHGERYDPLRGSVRAWLLSVTRHKAIDRYRRRRSLMTFHDKWGEAARSVMGGAPAPDEEVQRIQANRDLHCALRLLPSRRRLVIGLAFFRGMSHQEIADELRMPLGSVKSNIRRALIFLQLHLSEAFSS